jgi:hypothetical protein
MHKIIAWIRRLLFGDGLPKVGWQTIDDPLNYIVQSRSDGSRMTVHHNLLERRHDWPLPRGYEASESVMLDDGRVLQTFSFSEHGFNSSVGDGGQILKVGRDGFVRITQTRDGGKPFMQYFVGEGLDGGGTGWIVFGIDAPSGRWRDLVAKLSSENWEAARPAVLAESYTRYRLEMIAFPFHPGGPRTIETIISEHYDRNTIDGSVTMERSFFGRGYGLLRWELWGKTAEAPIADMDQRYQYVAFSDPPTAGWFLDDIRTFTNVVPCEPRAVPVMS